MDTTRRDRTWPRGIVVLVPLAVAAMLIALLAEGSEAQGSHKAADAPDEVVDQPYRFEVAPLARGAFTDDVAAQFRLRYDVPGQHRGTIVRNLRDAGEVVVAKVTFGPDGSSGWHTHPGPAVVNVIEGELAVTNAGDCVTRTYGPGEAWLDPGAGNVHVAENPSDEGHTVVYATFFGVPGGEAATEHVAPADC